MMRKLIGVALFVGLFSLVVAAQETPRPEVFGGYQFTSLDPSTNANGWNGSASMYLNHWFGVTGDVSGAYDSGLPAVRSSPPIRAGLLRSRMPCSEARMPRLAASAITALSCSSAVVSTWEAGSWRSG